MFNKKRLAMMALAAAMVFPNNLVYLATNTPIFAAEGEPTPITTDSLTTTKDGTAKYLKFETSGDYILDTDLNNILYVQIPEGIEVNLNMNGHNITTTWAVSVSVLGSLSLTGNGEENKNTITSTTTLGNTYDCVIFEFGEESKLIANGVNFTATQDGITGMSFFSSVYNSANPKRGKNEVTLTNVNFNTKAFAISVNGLMTEEDKPTITLDNVTMHSDSTAIYQAGPSNITVKNSNITSDVCGIETRAGTLNVSKSKIEGPTTTQTTVVQKNSNGTTTQNAGIAIAQHKRGPNDTYTTVDYPSIKVDIDSSTITGYTALVYSNPENNPDDALAKIGIKLSNSVLNGAKEGFDLAYQGNDIKSFTAQDVTLTNDEKPERVTMGTDGKLSLDEDNEDSILFVLTTSNTQTPTTLEGGDTILPTPTNKPEDGVLTLTSSEVNTVKANLQQEINTISQKTNNTFEAYDSTATSDGYMSKTNLLNYDYTVQEVANRADVLGDGSYNFKALITAVLEENSIVRLLIPGVLDDTTPETADMISKEAAAPTFQLNAQLKDVADNKKLSKDKILNVLNALGKTLTDDTVLDKVQNTDLSKTYQVERINTPITIEIKANGETAITNAKEYVSTPTQITTRPGGNKKPKPEEPMEEPVVGTPTTMYRLYNRLTGEHLYTIDKNERDNLLTSDTWKDEGEGWIAPSESAYPVYRLLNPNNSDHHYTTDKNEFDTLPSYGWIAEGIAFFSADKENPENVILYRLYNPNAEGAGSHHYTVDANERDTLVGLGWTYEGLAWAGLPENK